MNTFTLRARLQRVFTPAFAVIALLTFSFPSAASADAGGTPATPDRHPPFSALYVLGDSLSDTGRMAGIIPGVYAFLYPSPPYAPGRISNGPLWIEQFAPMVRRTYQPLDNFSWAGAGAGTQNVFGPGLPGIQNELAELLALSPQGLDRKALYVVFGGANDFFRILRGDAHPTVVIPASVLSLVTTVATLHGHGAENIVVIDLPDIGRTPRALAGGAEAAAMATYLSTVFNSGLNSALDTLSFPVVRVSMFNLINNFVAHPHKYGFTNVTSRGIDDLANAGTYLFWDEIHPTTRAHRFVAEGVFHALAAAGKLGQQNN